MFIVHISSTFHHRIKHSPGKCCIQNASFLMNSFSILNMFGKTFQQFQCCTQIINRNNNQANDCQECCVTAHGITCFFSWEHDSAIIPEILELFCLQNYFILKEIFLVLVLLAFEDWNFRNLDGFSKIYFHFRSRDVCSMMIVWESE